MEVCQNDDSAFLLTRFNQRDTSAFAMIYTRFFTELHVYANRLYAKTRSSLPRMRCKRHFVICGSGMMLFLIV